MRPLSEATSRISGKTFERKYIALGRIVKEWRLIMGDEFADKSFPNKIYYRKYKRSPTPQATLEVSVSSANAMLMHYRKDIILERLNSVFGEDRITDIKFTSDKNAPKMTFSKPVSAPETLTPKQESLLSDTISALDDPEMKERLLSLGRSVYQGAEA